MKNPITTLIHTTSPFIEWAEFWLKPPLLLAVRIYVALVFWRSGLTKLEDWDTTLLLFTDEYHVPLLPPALAAVLGAGGELILAPLLMLGLAGRFAAAGLFVLNLVAVTSYPGLNEVGVQQHLYWGMLLALLALVGTGKLSLDTLLVKHFG